MVHEGHRMVTEVDTGSATKDMVGSSSSPALSGDDDPNEMQGLVRITTQEAVFLQWTIIKNWKPRSDVWPFTYGIGILAAATSISGAYFNNHYRRVMKLRNYGQMSSLLPAVVLPALLTASAHLHFVSSEILISPTNPVCPICIEMRSVAIQVAFGAIHPLILTPMGAFALAARFSTYNVPPMFPLDNFSRHWWKITKPRVTSIGVIAVLQAAAAVIFTRAEYLALDTVCRKQEQPEQKYDDSNLT